MTVADARRELVDVLWLPTELRRHHHGLDHQSEEQEDRCSETKRGNTCGGSRVNIGRFLTVIKMLFFFRNNYGRRKQSVLLGFVLKSLVV